MSQNNTENSKKSPKERFQQPDQNTTPKSKKRALIIFPVLLGILLIGIFAWSFLTKNIGKNPVTAMTATEFTYPVSRFDDGRAQHFDYLTEDGITIRYFILKSADGVIRAAFDACDVCWPENKGYEQQGDYMVCRNCGRKFASVKVNEVKGGCNPAPLVRQNSGDKVVIQVADLLMGKQYFSFSNGGSR